MQEKAHIIKYIKYFKHSNITMNLKTLLQIKKSRASEIIALLLDYNLIESSNPTKYKFKK